LILPREKEVLIISDIPHAQDKNEAMGRHACTGKSGKVGPRDGPQPAVKE